DFGMGRSRGTLPFQISGNIKYGGLVEKAFGLTLRELLYDFGGGSFTGRPIRAVQVGGPLGAYIPESLFDTPLDYESFSGIRAMLGHGGAVAFDDTVDMAQMARFAMEFCSEESCGKCTPCREGTPRMVDLLDRVLSGEGTASRLEELRELAQVVNAASLCGLGQAAGNPILSALHFFGDEFSG
ncbi:MAG: formate dehydrogenase, partial [Chloroflexi bacterium]|nr:formate dehydrogenase [Chloroflexota bacterium]